MTSNPQNTYPRHVEVLKEDKPKTSIGSLTCCQYNGDSLSSVMGDEIVNMSEMEKANLNNNNNAGFQIRQQNVSKVFAKKQAVDLNFQDITFTSNSWSITKFRKETKKILHGVSGQFKSGELSVIMGPSGAGKSTLLNVLAGFITGGSTGTVKLNDVVRDQSPRYRKLSAYIPQDEELRMALTAKEAMTFAAHLKLGYNVSNDYKMQLIAGILEMLGLDQCQYTLTSRLSGGQRKRLAVALELLSNPPILFLDEPTTGLDSLSCTQCVSLFKQLAQEGRTVIATIHQPSALLFEMFDKLYALSAGKCIYDGRASDLVSFMDKQGFQCPSYHNPADYLMEVSMGEHGDISGLSEAVKIQQEKHLKSIEYITKDGSGKDSSDWFQKKKIGISSNESLAKPAAIIMQFLLLYKRNLLIIRRCYNPPLNRVLAHIIIGLIFGYLYRDVGRQANTILANYVYLYGTLLLTVYTGEMPVTLSFPLEMKILSREHFNRWYKLTPYLLSVILVEIPFQVICTWLYIGISYYLTNQPLDFRVVLFVIFVTASSLCAQSMGYFIGATTPVKVAVFTAPVLACFLSVFGFCIRSFDTPYLFKPVFFISYFRAAFQSVVFSIYGFDRGKLYCSLEDQYCHYADPEKFLREMDIVDIDLVSNIILIVCIWCVMHAATYLTLWLKLNKR